MQFLRDDESYRNSSALLGIHSAISYCDALRTGLEDETLASENHQMAADALQRLLSTRYTGNDDGLRHLKALLSKKSAVAYGSRRLGNNDFQLIFTQAERFTKWANSVGSQLKIEGWNHGD